MATRWELHDGQEQVGPLSEEQVLQMIRTDLPLGTLIRAEGTEDWKGLRTHAPFAVAVERRNAATPAPQPPAPVHVQNVVTVKPETSPVTWGCAGLAGLLILGMIMSGIAKSCETVPTVGSSGSGTTTSAPSP